MLTPWHLLLVLGTSALTVATIWALALVSLQVLRLESMADAVLGGMAAFVLLVNVEFHALSWIPWGRPLSALPWLHLTAMIAIGISVTARDGCGIWWEPPRRVVAEVHRTTRDGGLAVVFSLAVLAVLLLLFLGFDVYRTPTAWDGIEYHVPQAVQPYQDGRLGPVLSDLPWANAYPRGVALLWSWTLHLTRTDTLFHPVMWGFGVEFLLAVFVLARRSGASRWAAALATVVAGSMPLFFALTQTVYIDMASGAGAVAMLAILAPASQRPLGTRLLMAALPFGQCALVKVPVVPMVFGTLAIVACLVDGDLRTRLKELSRFLISWRGAVFVGIALLSSHTYFANWIAHGNPIYPIRMRLAGRTVLAGPVDPFLFGTGGHTTMGNIAQMGRLARFFASWADIFQPLDVDSFGSPGLAFLLAVLFPFAVFAAAGVLTRRVWPAALGAMFVASFALPGIYLPRYGLPMIAVAIAGAACTYSSQPPDLTRGLRWVVVALATWGAGRSVRDGRDSFAYLRSVMGPHSRWTERTVALPERIYLGPSFDDSNAYPLYMSTSMIRAVRDRSGPGDTLAWNVRTFHAHLWNRDYSNRVVFLPGTPRDYYPDGPHLRTPPTSDQLARWLASLAHLAPGHVLVYSKTAYALALREHPELGFSVVFEDPPSRGKDWMTLFERKLAGVAHSSVVEGLRGAP